MYRGETLSRTAACKQGWLTIGVQSPRPRFVDLVVAGGHTDANTPVYQNTKTSRWSQTVSTETATLDLIWPDPVDHYSQGSEADQKK